MEREYYLILGWLFGVLSMLVREKIQERKERQQRELDVISETLKFLFRSRNIYNNFHVDKKRYEQLGKAFPEKSSELEREMYENFDKDIKEEFFPQLMFQSFQLKRLKDKTFWGEFEIIMNKFEELGKLILAQENEDVIQDLSLEINDLKKGYIKKCLAKVQI